MKIQLFTFLCSCFLMVNSIFGQIQTLNSSYGVMLDTLISHTVNEVNPQQLQKKTSISFLDAREKTEYNISHIKGAIWVGYHSFKKKRVENINKETEIVVYCSVGYRSEKIAEKLKKIGFQNVSNLYGGIFEWVHYDNEVYNDRGVTDSIHVFNKNWGQWLQNGIKVY